MQIIRPNKPRSFFSRLKRRVKIVAILIVVLVIAATLTLIYGRVKKSDDKKSQSVTTNKTDTSKPVVRRLKTLSANDFKNMYNNFKYENVTETTTPPSITGNAQADERIQMIAEKRGYELRAQAMDGLVEIEGSKVQPPVVEPYQQLKAAALATGLDLNIVSGYRSYNEQRGIFTAQMKAKGATAASVAAGQSDGVIDSILKLNSIPGYSRHHTGYIVDFQCAKSGLDNFKQTPCFTWLNANNYENAKMYGFIPSYPDGATDQGPNPEEWEYAWVGTAILYETVK